MSHFNLEDHPHRRYNPLTCEWVLVSPHRAKRPWQGQTEKNNEEKRASYDSECYLCPGNSRIGGETNPKYTSTFCFTNDFSALLKDTPQGEINTELFKVESTRGICKVICYSPRHDLTVPEMDVANIAEVVELWASEYIELAQNPDINYIQIFENKGLIMGCSNPHPHGQIWSSSMIPNEVQKEMQSQEDFYAKHSQSLLENYVQQELEKKERILVENDHFVALVPFWAVWPFEALIISKRHVQHIGQLNTSEKISFADAYKKLTTMYDNLFETSFAYSAGIHQAPSDGKEHKGWHMHMHFYPPLLRSAEVKKFMVGYEMLGMPQRDITAETAAAQLRALPKIHYKQYQK